MPAGERSRWRARSSRSRSGCARWISFKAPGIAETLDWAEALVALDRVALDPQTVADTAGVLLKYQDDVGALGPDVVAKIIADVETEGIRL